MATLPTYTSEDGKAETLPPLDKKDGKESTTSIRFILTPVCTFSH